MIYRALKLGPDSSEKGEVIAQNDNIFCQFKSKLAITHAIAIKWKEK